MRTTLAQLLDPQFSTYRSIGELARTLQHLMATATEYRYPGRWGSSGPTEILAGYGSCTNSANQPWHSGRITTGCDIKHLTTWQQNHDSIYNCILSALCSRYDQWRKEQHIAMDMGLKFQMAYQNQDREKEAWKQFESLHCYRLPISTLNSCHRNINMLAEPELEIAPSGIRITVSVTNVTEWRNSKDCFSRWDAGVLTHTEAPRWWCQRETFANFILRTAMFYKKLQPTPECVKAHLKKGAK